jgi:serine/threonine protein kinase
MDQRSDLYAVGTVLFEMLCGRLPFASESEYELLRAQVENPAPPVGQFVGGVPAFVSEAVRCAMEKDPARRYPSCGEMASFLRDSAAAQGCQLKAVAEVLEIKPQAAAGSHLTTVYSLCQRIDVLIQNGNYDTAERRLRAKQRSPMTRFRRRKLRCGRLCSAWWHWTLPATGPRRWPRSTTQWIATPAAPPSALPKRT